MECESMYSRARGITTSSCFKLRTSSSTRPPGRRKAATPQTACGASVSRKLDPCDNSEGPFTANEEVDCVNIGTGMISHGVLRLRDANGRHVKAAALDHDFPASRACFTAGKLQDRPVGKDKREAGHPGAGRSIKKRARSACVRCNHAAEAGPRFRRVNGKQGGARRFLQFFTKGIEGHAGRCVHGPCAKTFLERKARRKDELLQGEEVFPACHHGAADDSRSRTGNGHGLMARRHLAESRGKLCKSGREQDSSWNACLQAGFVVQVTRV